ncbi:thioredoxin family protein [Sphingobacterium lactis]|uniref:thioredoxin family protein n=1 Tax=Sphingobacterium lactis TaxID=797291 RepID=UPI003F81E56F
MNSILSNRKGICSYLLVFFLFLIKLEAYGQPVHFDENSSLESHLVASRNSGKLIFIDMYTDWCGSCKWMDAEVFSQVKLGKRMNAEFINVKINAEKGEGIAIAKKYYVTSYPTYLFLDHEGTLIHKATGFMVQDKLVEHLTKAQESLTSKDNLKKLTQEFESNRKNSAFFYQYLKKRTSLALDNADLMDEYVSLIGTQEAAKLINLQLIADNASFNARSLKLGQALDVLISRSIAYDSLENSEDVETYVQMAQMNSLNRAIENRDETLLEKVISYNKYLDLAVFDEEQDDAIRLRYFYATKNPEQYKKIARIYLEDKLLKLSQDSLLKLDGLIYESVKKRMEDRSKGNLNPEQKKHLLTYRHTQTIVVNRGILSVCQRWMELDPKTNEMSQLINWINYSLKLMEIDQDYYHKIIPESLSLLAKIHYLKGDRSLAIKTKKAAIKALKARDFENERELVHSWEKELLSM